MNDVVQISKRFKMNMHNEHKKGDVNNRCKEQRTRQYFSEKKKQERRKTKKPSHHVSKCAIRTPCSDLVEHKEDTEYDIEESNFGLYMHKFACEFEWLPSATEERAYAKMYTRRCKMTFV